MFVRYRAASTLRMEWVLFRSVSSMEPSFCPQCFCLQLWSKIWAVNGPSSSLWAVMWHIPLETLRRAGVCISLPFVLTGFFAEQYQQLSIFIYSISSKWHFYLCKCETQFQILDMKGLCVKYKTDISALLYISKCFVLFKSLGLVIFWVTLYNKMSVVNIS